ncbi:hypothetical protein VTN00DRAFT_1870 [Thermoascus crustaceus]|uniref:uncharacterized protein n=1 Tax=Thermoascus crustaceus TaxID=5088 RepID=UPI003743D8B7
MNWSTKDYGPDGPWQAVEVSVGSPPQTIALYPGGTWSSVVLTTATCQNKSGSQSTWEESWDGHWTPLTTSSGTDRSSGLSTGDKAGIGVGVTVGGSIIIAAGIFLLARRRHDRSNRTRNNQRTPAQLEGKQKPAELEGQNGPAELGPYRPLCELESRDPSL